MDSNHVDQQLHKACQLYSNRNYKESLDTLKKVCFTKFDVKEWVFQNNILLCEIKMHLNDNRELSENMIYKLRQLMEKVRGLPCQVQTLQLELCIGLNYSLVLIAGSKMMDGCFKAGAVLTNNIIRVAQVHGCAVDLPDCKDTHFSKAFASDVMTSTLESIQDLFKRDVDPNCLVDAGIKMLEILRSHLENIKETELEQRVVIVDPSIAKHLFPISLLRPQTSYHGDLKALVVFQISLCFSLCQNDSIKALGVLNSLATTSSCSSLDFYIDYLKGYILYEQDQVDKAMKCFIRCRDNNQVTEVTYRAAAISMIGRCLATKGKPHTAIARFKEALYCSFGHLDALFYTAQQHQQLGQTDSEIQSLKYLCTALGACKDGSNCTLSLLHGPFVAFIDNLNGRAISLSYAMYWHGRRCLELQRFSEASDAFIDVIAQVTSTSHSKLSNSPFVLPPLMRLHRGCAFALLKADKFEECVTVCDIVLGDLLNGDSHGKVKDSAKRKRSQQSKDDDLTGKYFDQLELLVCKAFAVLRLDQPFHSLQFLQRFFDEVDLNSKENKGNDSQLHKRRRLDIGDPHKTIETVVLEAKENKQDENCSLLRIKSQAHMVRATVLQSMDKDKESLEELYQSILCDADNISAVYQYSRLLFKLGSADIAASNWMKYKELYRDHGQTVISREDGDERLPLPSLIEVTGKELQDLDKQAALEY